MTFKESLMTAIIFTILLLSLMFFHTPPKIAYIDMQNELREAFDLNATCYPDSTCYVNSIGKIDVYYYGPYFTEGTFEENTEPKELDRIGFFNTRDEYGEKVHGVIGKHIWRKQSTKEIEVVE